MKRIFGLVSAFLLVAAIAPAQDVSYNFDQQTDFSKFKTYKWVEVEGAEKIDELTTRQLLAALDQHLALKGLTKTDSDSADLYVAYQVAVSKEKQVNVWSSGYGMGPGWGGSWYGGYYRGYSTGGASTTTTSTIYVGSVALDMYDPSTKHLVWRGVASKQIDTKASGDKRQKNLDKGAKKLLKNYPPKKKS